MATKKAKCLKRGKHNKCLKRAHRVGSLGGVRRGRGRKRICRKKNGQIKRCGR